MKVIVHGGAGGAPDEPGPRQDTLDEAAAAGADADTPVDAVEDAVRVLEADARFNAGRGGAVQSDGVVRTDAGVMTSDRETGAATSMPGVEHAVTVARHVMTDTPHIQLAGVHAVDFAADVGVETECDLWTEQSKARWDDLDTHPEGTPLDHVEWLEEKFGGHDTVGAVAFDGDDFAVATSTGGRWLALAGRVGDVPQVGSGFYASPAGAASATGAGEDIAKTTLTRRAVRHLESGHDAQDAARLAVEEFAELTGSTAGVIVLDADGNAGEAFNAEAMQTAVDE
ncbi:isoaspartyl peptidase/L-asparaginase [Halocalculus aciditolerans]|uniref:Plant-type L-asparaginase n=1 Tax=Halocalculus aciditolerans TaxID=1383812 RepID=A0A830F0B6_9EURY|nr:isoaspartyl peptidase/L-asparaginase [Halocalculus aciditolerans]GGL50239.1 asparaginase [Halocalculus aciditolerans]